LAEDPQVGLAGEQVVVEAGTMAGNVPGLLELVVSAAAQMEAKNVRP
jgi:hypothetical protein